MPKKESLGQLSSTNWNQVYYFSLVASHGSIKKAAEILQLSPSTLSEHISQLESHLNTELFVRRGPRLSLTERGHRLFIHAKGMFEHGERLLDAVSPRHLGNYPISVGFIPGAHLPLAYKWVAMYREKYFPHQMKLQHCSADSFEASIVKGRFDFGFSDHPPERPDLLCAQIARCPIRFYVSNDWRDFSLAELLSRLPLLVCRSETSTKAYIEKALQEADLTPSSVITSDFPSVLVDFCLQGLGVGTFCEEPILKMNARSIRSLRSPKDAPIVESNLYVVWSIEAENTATVAHLQELIKGELTPKMRRNFVRHLAL